MSPDAPQIRRFGRTPPQAIRAAVLLTLLGVGALAEVDQLLSRRTTMLGDLIHRTGLPVHLLFLFGVPVVVGLAVLGAVQSIRSAERFEILPEGLRVTGHLGRYLLAWDNIVDLRVTPTGSLGVKVRDRVRLHQTHEGTQLQRGWLETMEPWGEWDLLYPRVALGMPAERVAGWLDPYLRRES